MSAFEQVHPHLWMVLPVEERAVLAEAFGLVRNGISEIRNEEVISDGYSADDLARITKQGMEEWVGAPEESFSRLWELTVAKARYVLNPPEMLPVPGAVQLREATPEEAEALIAAQAPEVAKSKKAKAGDHGTA